MAIYVLYIPGLGDDTNGEVQRRALEKWRKFGVEPLFQTIIWNNNEPYKQKLNKILKVVDELAAQKHTTSLVGASAGASMALNVYSERKGKINSVVFISGKINQPQTLSARYKKDNPAFLDSVIASTKQASQLTDHDRQKMLTIFPLYDGKVTKSDATISGVKNKTLPNLFHAANIYLSITLYKRLIINFIKAKSVQ
jgi:pimeloyl-ACP methyl ester carboxylesterase